MEIGKKIIIEIIFESCFLIFIYSCMCMYIYILISEYVKFKIIVMIVFFKGMRY